MTQFIHKNGSASRPVCLAQMLSIRGYDTVLTNDQYSKRTRETENVKSNTTKIEERRLMYFVVSYSLAAAHRLWSVLGNY